MSDGSGDGSSLESIRAFRPELAAAIEHFHEFAATKIDPMLLELCRLRIAQIQNNSQTAPAQTTAGRAAGVTEAQLRNLANWRESDQFDSAQKACLTMAEYFCYTAQSVTDEQVADIANYLSPEQILTLTAGYWVSDASGRLANFLESLGVSK